MTEKRKSSSDNSQISEPQAEPWIDPDDAPELTDELLDRVADTIVWRQGDKIIRRGRPPLGDQVKGTVTIRLDADVLEAYRALGSGWQTQINADLRRARKLGKKLKSA